MKQCRLFLLLTGITLSISLLLLTSCHKNEDVQVELPIIILDSQTATYNVKVDKTITISPQYKNVDNATFTWTENGKVISTDRELNYSWSEIGEKYITITVVNAAGETFIEFKVNVLDKVLPSIEYAIPEGGLNIMSGVDFAFEPIVENDDKAKYAWYIDGEKVSEEKYLTHKFVAPGEYNIRYVVENEDGQTEFNFVVKVFNAEDFPFSWNFERETYYLSKGRSIRVIARNVQNEFDATYTFTLNGSDVQSGKEKFYIFDKSDEGEYELIVTMKNQYQTINKKLKVVVCPAEGTYKRTATSASNVRLNKVFEFLAAPGQFINENYSATTMEEANAYAESRLISGGGSLYLSLGAWGGSVVVGFDHSIENDGGYNIQIRGNAFDGSSEPGIVWVMQDENGNGLPDDTWYELKGSDYAEQTRDYWVTYFKPSSPKQATQWTDSEGNSGSIDYLGSFHKQDYYYPNWVSTSSYTIYGSKLKSKTIQESGIWKNLSFDWGYADNWSSSDRIDASSTTSNHFKISNAVTWDGKPANLQYIDFIKVQTGVNAKAGIIGENSTEVQDFKDYNLIK